MTRPDLKQLFLDKVAEFGPSKVGKMLGYSPSAISQAVSDSYKGSIDNILRKVEEVYGTTTCHCPAVQDDITLGRCADLSRRPLVPTNPASVRLYRACANCDRRK